jgi:phenylalanyl-tRNA synthetase beta chain
MKVSRQWLQNFFKDPLPDAEALADALTFHAFEIESVEGDILDVKVTPNRGHDALSHRGIARELSAILNLPFNAEKDPFARPIDLSKKTDAVEVRIDDPELCRRYVAGYIQGVKVGPSPNWLRNSLESIGQKSINNIVDATNLVMFNIGQPLHAFDANKLKEENRKLKIEVRRAREGEKITTLDNKEYQLQSSNLLIAAGNSDEPIGIAGVKGGIPASITEETTDIIIESANFDSVSVRKTAAALKLRTDASQRFEQALSPELAAYGMSQVVDLITAIAGGEVAGFVDEYPGPLPQKPVSVTLSGINGVLGTNYSDEEVCNAFERLGFAVSKGGSTYTVIPSFERLDIVIPEDLVEEVGRIIGYDKAEPKQLPALDRAPAVNKNFYWSERVREFLVGKGFSEIYTSVFAEEGERVVLNKVDGVKPYLRESLVPSMEESLEKNKRNAEMLGLPDVRLFEIGTVFAKDGERLMLAVGVKGNKKSPKPEAIVQEMLEEVGKAGPSELARPGLASSAEIDLQELIAQFPEPTEYEKLPLSEAERYQPFSKYPFIIRDVAFWAPADVNPAEIEKIIKEIAGALCTKSFLFDRFEKDGKVSLAYRLVFQSFERTLTEEEVNPNMNAVYTALKDKGFEIR